MITVLDSNGNRFQLPKENIKTVSDLKQSLENNFRIRSFFISIIFKKNILNNGDRIPPDCLEHPFIISQKSYTLSNNINDSSHNVKKGLFDHFFMNSSVFPPELPNETNALDSESSFSSDIESNNLEDYLDSLTRNFEFPINENDLFTLNNFDSDFLNLSLMI